jgi:hypothetical protein
MKGTLEQPAGAGLSWLCLLRADGSYEKLEDVGPGTDRRDPPQGNQTEAETSWAGRSLAMRRSARVAA